MNIGFIGYGNHASRLTSLLDESSFEKILRYHPSKASEGTTNDLISLFDCDAVFITSPNETHFDYIDLLVDKSDCYIFCEKPPATTMPQLSKLKGYCEKNKGRIFFNFNYRFSALAKILQNIQDTDCIGGVMLINAAISHGLAFKDGYERSWRANYEPNKSVVLDTSLIHLVDLFNYIHRSSDTLSVVSCQSSSFYYGSDTCSITLSGTKGLVINLFASYAAPYQFKMSATGTDGLIEINRDGYALYSPRDTFNDEGLFIDPPKQESRNYNFECDYVQSLKNSLEYFMDHLDAKDELSISHYDTSLETMEFLMEGEQQISSVIKT